MLPDQLPIRREEDYHTHFLGKYGDGQMFIGLPFFGGESQTRPLAVLHLFDSEGTEVSSEIWERDKMYEAEAELKSAIDKLPSVEYGDVKIKPFSVVLNDLTFGLIPRADGSCIEYLPYGLAFFPPWDGFYET